MFHFVAGQQRGERIQRRIRRQPRIQCTPCCFTVNVSVRPSVIDIIRHRFVFDGKVGLRPPDDRRDVGRGPHLPHPHGRTREIGGHPRNAIQTVVSIQSSGNIGPTVAPIPREPHLYRRGPAEIDESPIQCRFAPNGSTIRHRQRHQRSRAGALAGVRRIPIEPHIDPAAIGNRLIGVRGQRIPQVDQLRCDGIIRPHRRGGVEPSMFALQMEIIAGLIRKVGGITKAAHVVGGTALPIDQETVRHAIVATRHIGPGAHPDIIEVTGQHAVPAQIIGKPSRPRRFQNAVLNLDVAPAKEYTRFAVVTNKAVLHPDRGPGKGVQSGRHILFQNGAVQVHRRRHTHLHRIGSARCYPDPFQDSLPSRVNLDPGPGIGNRQRLQMDAPRLRYLENTRPDGARRSRQHRSPIRLLGIAGHPHGITRRAGVFHPHHNRI